LKTEQGRKCTRSSAVYRMLTTVVLTDVQNSEDWWCSGWWGDAVDADLMLMLQVSRS